MGPRRGTWCTGALGVLAGLARAEEAPEIAPAHIIPLPGVDAARSPIFSADGQTVYVVISQQAINLWELLVYYWPEVGGALLGLFLAVLSGLTWRAVRRGRVVGLKYCRKCGYCLEGAPTALCPECGDPAAGTRAAVERPLRRRVAIAGCAAALASGVYAAALLAHVPRQASWSDWRPWWSTGLAEQAKSRSWTNLAKHACTIERIVEVGTAHPSAQRILYTGDDLRIFGVSAVGGDLVLADGAGWSLPKEFTCVNLRSGRAQRRRLPEFPGEPLGEPMQLLDVRRPVYLKRVDWQRQALRVLAYDPATGRTGLIMEFDGFTTATADLAVPRLHLLPGTPARLLVELDNSDDYIWSEGLGLRPAPGWGGSEPPYRLQVRNLERRGEIVSQFSLGSHKHQSHAFDSAGRRMFWVNPAAGGLVGLDLETGESIPPLRAMPGSGAPRELEMGSRSPADGNWVRWEMVQGREGQEHRHLVLVGNLDWGTWVAALAWPPDARTCPVGLPYLSSDGRRAVGAFLDKKQQPCLAVWDLPVAGTGSP